MSFALASLDLRANNILFRLGQFNRYTGSHCTPAVKLIQMRYKNYVYRQRVPLGSGTYQDDLEQIQGFMRTMIRGVSIEDRNAFAIRLTREFNRNFGTTRWSVRTIIKQLYNYANRFPPCGMSTMNTRGLNAAFKVVSIIHAVTNIPKTHWDHATGRWSNEHETIDTLLRVKQSLLEHDRDAAGRAVHCPGLWGSPSLGLIWSQGGALGCAGGARRGPLNQYIYALKFICSHPDYYSAEWESILADFS